MHIGLFRGGPQVLTYLKSRSLSGIFRGPSICSNVSQRVALLMIDCEEGGLCRHSRISKSLADTMHSEGGKAHGGSGCIKGGSDALTHLPPEGAPISQLDTHCLEAPT